MSILPQHVISVAQLSDIITEKNLILLDASIPPIGNMKPPSSVWPDVSIANARYFDIEHDFSDTSSRLPHTLPSPEKFEQSCRKLGINNDSQIVVYDNLGMFSSARAWYMLKAMGHKHVAVLNGGLPAWVKAGKPVEQAKRTEYPFGTFTVNYMKAYFVDADFVQETIHHSNVTIFDARSTDRFVGTAAEPRVGVRSGHIPQSISFPYAELLDEGQLKRPDELLVLFQKQHANMDNTWIMSCGSGITACILALAAGLIGHQHTRVYDGSWSEWGQDTKRPIATGL